MNVNDIVNRVSKYDSNLAKEISRYLNSRKYGLVYEESKPEFVRLPNKTVVKGDLVNILPPRGTVKSDDSKYQDKWRVTALDKEHNKVKVMSLEKEDKTLTVNYDDLVAIARFDQPVYTGLKEVDRIERGGDKPFNTVINGENFHALETLMYAYQGKIDCIYIDPPYNTGAKDWKYNNNYVSSDDSYRHSKWLTFMEDRLKLAKKLLNPKDSVLICTIDEKEYNRLGILLDQLFPEANIQMISSVINPSGVSRGNEFYRTDEYIYFVKIGKASPQPLALSTDWLTAKKTGKDKIRWRPIRRQGSHDSRADAYNEFYPIYLSKDGKKFVGTGEPLAPSQKVSDISLPESVIAIWPIKTNGEDGCWQISRDTFSELNRKGYTRIKYSKKWGYTLQYLAKGEQKKVENGQFPIIGRNYEGDGSIIVGESEKSAPFIPGTQWRIPSHSAREYGSGLLNRILKTKRFSFPKSLYAEADTIRFFVKNKPNAIILDFFAGSGTTAHAVDLLNSEDNGKRQVICVTNNEVSAEESKHMSKKGLRAGDADWEKYGIAHHVTWPRIKCAISGDDVNGNPIKGTYDLKEKIYHPINATVVDEATGKKKQKKFYEAKNTSVYPELKDKMMSDGFKENAIFFDLEYLEPSVIKSDLAFNQIAPLLWLKAGSKGRIIQHKDDYDMTSEYAVLFNYKYIGQFIRQLKQHSEIKTVFIVTDVNSRYQDLCHELSDRNVYKLYESYLKPFEIQSLS